jgi:hypothetical protein
MYFPSLSSDFVKLKEIVEDISPEDVQGCFGQKFAKGIDCWVFICWLHFAKTRC